jgi:alkanesulfonate monooxygenase SsuD/methylene tetrahydromethanopterin reductase-like flavin-dependent oxidoreductase (luciferase family)
MADPGTIPATALDPRRHGACVQLGLGLPNNSPFGLSPDLLLDWARLGDDAGFSLLATVDRPNYDLWDPLTTLAAVAAVTSRARLVTSILVLPPRNEILVAKQAAVVDVLSKGRLELGVALGSRADDYAVFGATTAHRVTRLRRQITRIRETWADARLSTVDHGVCGPAPVQDPPPILLGGVTDPAQMRAVELGDGIVFGGAARAADLAQTIPVLRQAAAARGKKQFTFTGFVYVAVGGSRELDQAAAQLTRYYPVLVRPAEEMVVHGELTAIAETVAAYADAGLDRLILAPALPELAQVSALAEHLLPVVQ